MRWRRAATIVLTALALVVVARPAGAMTYVGLHDLTCEGAITEGTGMAKGARLEVALVDPASDRTLSRGRVSEGGCGRGRPGGGRLGRRGGPGRRRRSAPAARG